MTTQRGPRKAASKKAAPMAPENAPEVPQEPAPAAPEADVETAGQRRIRELEEQIATLTALMTTQKSSNEEAEEKSSEGPEEGETIHIHFIDDGFTAQGQIWYRGQELVFVVGSRAWEDTLDSRGDSWVLRTEDEQADRYGKIYFRRGPWPGKKTYLEGAWEKDAPPEHVLKEADIKERERLAKGAPALPKNLDKLD